MAVEDYPKFYLYRRIVQAKLFIDANYTRNIDVNNISDEACFSKFHFIRLFKQAYGKTPHQYLISVRIEKARALLQADNSVLAVCLQVGFESLGSFSGLFKKTVGTTPSAFMDHHQKIKKATTKTPLKFVPACYISNNGWAENSNFEEMPE